MFVNKSHNKDLPFVLQNWGGNPQDKKGNYLNLDGASERTLKETIQWQTNRKNAKQAKKKQHCNVPVNVNTAFISNTVDGITWLGHCTFYIRLNGLNIITDPLLYNLSILKRNTALPCKVKELNNIDIILLSHNHRDHCDKRSLTKLCKLNPKAVILTGLSIKPLLRTWFIANDVIEAGWYQQYNSIKDLNITYLPAKHWSRRYLRDLNTMLWGSFMLQTNNTTIYFGADSGLGIHFKQIGELFPNIDYAMLGVGAYEPNWFMHTSHTSPSDAVKAFVDLQASKLIPTHYGTLDLSDEPLQEPLEKLIAMKNNNILPLTIGEKLFF